MTDSYDAFIIGTGASGTTFAYKLKDAGMKVGIADRREYGGTCALRGCVPKKVLTGAASIVDAHNRMLGKGIENGRSSIDWKTLINFKRTFTGSHPELKEKGFRDSGIDTYHGTVRFVNESTLAVGDIEVRAGYIVITTGSKPRKLNIPGEEYFVTSEQFMDLQELPERIIFAGGGYISFEFAHVAARAGAEVTILQRGDRVLKQFDPDLVDMLVKASEEAGISVITGQEIKKIERTDREFRITACCMEDDTENAYLADMVVHGLGRVPDLEQLQLENGNVALENGNIVLNEHFQSVSNPRVYAAGDCIRPGPLLTPVVSMQADVAAGNIIDGNSYTADYSIIPSAVFTIPPLASVGLAEKASIPGHKVLFHDMEQWFSTKRTNLKNTASKVIIDEATDRILGAHILAPDAEELINLFAVAMNCGVTATQLRSTMFAYPSTSYDLNYILR